MDKLLRKRKSLDMRLNRASQNAESLQSMEDTDDIDIQTELDNLHEIWAAYIHLHNKMIGNSSDEEMEEILQHQSTFESNFIGLKGALLKLRKNIGLSSPNQDHTLSQDGSYTVQRLAEQQAEFLRILSNNLSPTARVSWNPTAAAQSNSPSTDVKLPRMILPTFDGNILEWPSFFDLFESAVHMNTTLSNSQKLYFLKTNLIGEAAALVSHLSIEDANYAPALAKLKARDHKPLEIVAEHIQRFLKQPSMTSPSAAGLRSLHDVSDEVLRALVVMDQKGRDIWLLHILVEKLDPETKLLWCQKRVEWSDEEITLQRFLDFIDNQSYALKSTQSNQQNEPSIATQLSHTNSPRRSTTLVAIGKQTHSPSCGYCHRSSHQLYQCGKFRHTTVDKRLDFVRRQNLCQNCLKHHFGKRCRSSYCRKCGFLHHTLLHDALRSSDATTPVSTTTIATDSFPSPTMPKTPISCRNSASVFTDTNVLLLTATVNVFDSSGRPHTCRAVLDCASHTSYIAADLCRKLGLSTTDVDFEIEGIAGSANHTNQGAVVTFASRCSDYQNRVPCIILDRLASEIPAKHIDVTRWPIPTSIRLADPDFYKPGKISLLLGSKLFFHLLEPGTIKMGPDDCLPILQNTKLGWVLSGGYKPFFTNSGVARVGGRRTKNTQMDLEHGLKNPEGILVGGLCSRDIYGRPPPD